MPKPAAERDSGPRRQILMLAAGSLALLVTVVLLLGGGDDSAEGPTTPQNPTAPATARVTGRLASVPKAGIAVRVPRGWTATTRTREVGLRSADRSATVAIGLPPGARDSSRLLASALKVARRRLRDVRVTATDTRRIAGLPAISAIVSGRSRRSGPIRGLVGAVQGRRRAWLIEVFVAEGGRAETRLAEGQLALQSLKLSE